MTLLSSLRSRIFFASALLAVVSMGVAIYVVNDQVTRQAESELQRGLEEAATLVEEYRTRLFEQFIREARLVADLPKLKAAVELDHAPTVQPIAEDYHQQIRSDLFVVTNRAGAVLAAFGPLDVPPEQIGRLPAVGEAIAGREATAFWPRTGGVLQVVSVPIWIGPDHPEILGSLSVGFHLDERVAARFRDLTNSEIAFAIGGRIQASTLPAEYETAVEALLSGEPAGGIALGGSNYVSVRRSLAPAGGDLATAAVLPAGAPPPHDAPTALILRSRTERLQFLNRLHTVLGFTALVAVLAATLLGYAVARTVTQPLGTITAAMRTTARTGDLTRRIPLPSGRWVDEDARLLADTFNTMTGSIARFQRDAAQRERLSSLGRLSTVVAHEVRNPLMIIKTSLRALERGKMDPARVSRAVADIDEEVARLNRIVTEVLDFARPIRFELAPADLNALCADAAAATGAGEPGARIRLACDPGVPPVVTDRERLRVALVNILSNARQAESQEDTAGSSGHAIELETRALGPHRVAIVVRDRGPGIAPDDLPRIFDPYFTTKRTGSGLGLPIARNIVEGLGGTIGVRSEPGKGTEMWIELPVEGTSTQEGAEAAGI